MADLEKAIHGLIDPIIEHPDSVIIKQIPGHNEKELTVLIVAEDDDTARLIGRKGVVANALREVISIAPKADDSNIRIRLKFESFSEEDESVAE